MRTSRKRRMQYYEFFAGGGMARLGLGNAWECVFANDVDQLKAACYRNYFKGAPELRVGDIARVQVSDLPGRADLAWASFPCQDLSLAGSGAGLKGERSGLFWEFWRLIRGLNEERRAPRSIIIENVYGAITSHKGGDLAAIFNALATEGYRFAPMVIDAALFLPQSRPRLFVIGFQGDANIPASLLCPGPQPPWHPEALGTPYDLLNDEARLAWLWLRLPIPPRRAVRLVDLIEDQPSGVEWHTAFETRRLLAMMTPINQEKVRMARLMGTRTVGAVYRRTRPDEYGIKAQRAEVRFDDVAGCLRTPGGGSSRQSILLVEGNNVRSRLLSPREAARLMGIPDSYPLPHRYNDAYHLAGDGIAVPVVRHLRINLLEPILAKTELRPEQAA